MVFGLISVCALAQEPLPVAFLPHERESGVYDAVSHELGRVKKITVDLCDPKAIVVVFDWQDLQALDKTCSTPQMIFFVGLSATDALLSRPSSQGYFASSSMYKQLEATQRLVEGPLTVLFSEQSELEAIERFQAQFPQRPLSVVQVSASAQAIKALGRGILKTSAVVLGANPEIFNETFIITARKMSLKFLTPLVGGSSADLLKKGTVFGVFVSDADGQKALKHWLATGEFIQPPEKLMINSTMLSYFGLMVADE